MVGSRSSRAVLTAVAISGSVLAVAIAFPALAGASQIVQPATSPVAVTVAPDGTTGAITVVASGFAPNALVYVEQCDGVAPSTTQWSPTVHCDLGSSPSSAIADSRGVATFSSTDRNRAFRPFAGESPQTLFNCLAPAQAAPKNDLPNYTNCTLRVSTSNTAVTADQTFMPVALTMSSHAAATTTTTASGAKGAGGTVGAATGKQSSTSTMPSERASKEKAAFQGRSSAASSKVAVVSAPPQKSVGFLSLSDSDLTTGYVLVLAGLLVAALTISLRRRRPEVARTVTETQIVGER